MAASDARPVPQKNVAYRHYFAIRKNDGTLITTWAGQDTELSADGGAFADATNEATEIGTSGIGYIELTAGEMNYDCVIIKTTVTNTGALPYVVTLFPEESGDIRCNAAQLGGTTQTGRDIGASVLLAADQAVNCTKVNGAAQTAGDLAALITTIDGIVDTIVSRVVGTIAAGTHNPQSGDTYALANGASGFVAIKAETAAILDDTDLIDNGTSGLAKIATDVAAILVDTGTTLDTLIKDIPTVAEFEARTLPSADYVVVTDTIAGVTLVATTTNLTNAPTSGDLTSTMKTSVQTAATAALNAYDPPTNGEMTAAFTQIKGATWSTTDTLEAIRDRGDAAWVTATGFSTHNAADVADAVWDELTSAHSVSDSFGWMIASIRDDTDTLNGDWTDGQRLDLILDAIKAKTDLMLDATAVANAVWDSSQASHTSAGTFGLYVDAKISEAGGGGLTAADIADAVWDEVATGHIDTGKAGAQLWTVINTLSSGSAINITSTNTVIESE